MGWYWNEHIDYRTHQKARKQLMSVVKWSVRRKPKTHNGEGMCLSETVLRTVYISICLSMELDSYTMYKKQKDGN